MHIHNTSLKKRKQFPFHSMYHTQLDDNFQKRTFILLVITYLHQFFLPSLLLPFTLLLFLFLLLLLLLRLYRTQVDFKLKCLLLLFSSTSIDPMTSMIIVIYTTIHTHTLLLLYSSDNVYTVDSQIT